MNEAILIAKKLEQGFDLGFILLSTMTAFAALEGFISMLSVVVLVANLVYILPKIKRTISLDYRNSIVRYVKQFFNKNARYDRRDNEK